MREHACVGGQPSTNATWWATDAQGIELCRVCAVCEAEKLARYRPEILSGYDRDDVYEPIDVEIDWEYIDNPPDQSSSDDDWYALHTGGYLKPEEVLADPNQIRMIRDAETVIASFFRSLRARGLRVEM